MNNIVESNCKSKSKVKLYVKVSNAISSLDNECIKMRDMSKRLITKGELEQAKIINDLKKQYYSLLHHTYKYLFDLGRLKATGFYRQEFMSLRNNIKVIQRLYELDFYENKYYTITNITNEKFNNKNCLGTIDGLFEVRENELFSCNEAINILTDFTRCNYNKDTKTYRISGHLYRGLIKYYSNK